MAQDGSDNMADSGNPWHAKFKEGDEKRIWTGQRRCIYCNDLIEIVGPVGVGFGYQPCVVDVDGIDYFYHYNCLSKVEQDGRAARKRRDEEEALDALFTKRRREN